MAREIELRLNDAKDLFVFDADGHDPFDPHALDRPGVEEVLALVQPGLLRPVAHRLVVWLPPDRCREADPARVRAAIIAYADRRLRELHRELGDFLGTNLVLLALAVVVVAAGLTVGARLAAGELVGDPVTQQTLQTALDVLIWVALWAPIAAFTQDWIPYWRRRRTLLALRGIDLALRADPDRRGGRDGREQVFWVDN